MLSLTFWFIPIYVVWLAWDARGAPTFSQHIAENPPTNTHSTGQDLPSIPPPAPLWNLSSIPLLREDDEVILPLGALPFPNDQQPHILRRQVDNRNSSAVENEDQEAADFTSQFRSSRNLWLLRTRRRTPADPGVRRWNERLGRFLCLAPNREFEYGPTSALPGTSSVSSTSLPLTQSSWTSSVPSSSDSFRRFSTATSESLYTPTSHPTPSTTALKSINNSPSPPILSTLTMDSLYTSSTSSSLQAAASTHRLNPLSGQSQPAQRVSFQIRPMNPLSSALISRVGDDSQLRSLATSLHTVESSSSSRASIQNMGQVALAAPLAASIAQQFQPVMVSANVVPLWLLQDYAETARDQAMHGSPGMRIEDAEDLYQLLRSPPLEIVAFINAVATNVIGLDAITANVYTSALRSGASYQWEIHTRRYVVTFRDIVEALRPQFREVNRSWQQFLQVAYRRSPGMDLYLSFSSHIFDTMMEACTAFIESQIGTSVHAGSNDPTTLSDFSSPDQSVRVVSQSGTSVQTSPQRNPQSSRPPRPPTAQSPGSQRNVANSVFEESHEELPISDVLTDVIGFIEQPEEGPDQYRRIRTA